MDKKTEAAAAAIKSNVDDFFAGTIDRATFDSRQSALWSRVETFGPHARRIVSREVCPL